MRCEKGKQAAWPLETGQSIQFSCGEPPRPWACRARSSADDFVWRDHEQLDGGTVDLDFLDVPATLRSREGRRGTTRNGSGVRISPFASTGFALKLERVTDPNLLSYGRKLADHMRSGVF